MIVKTEHIKQVVKKFFENKPVKRVWLFGSYARGEASDTSDIDVLIDIEMDARIGFQYFSWNTELSEMLNKKVDIVSHGWENKFIKPFIDKDKMVIYEK